MTTEEREEEKIEEWERLAEMEDAYFKVKIEKFEDAEPLVYEGYDKGIYEQIKKILEPLKTPNYQVMAVPLGAPLTALKPVAEFDNFDEAFDLAVEHNAGINPKNPEPGACAWVAVSREGMKQWMIERFYKDNQIKK